MGLTASAIFYLKSDRQREPIFIVDPVRTEIPSSDRISEVPIKITRHDGTEIKSDLNSLQFYFWNAGKEPIKKNNVLEKLRFQFEDTSIQIVDFRISKTSRSICEFQLVSSPTLPSSSLLLDFFIIEEMDGFTGQIIYEGDPRAQLTLMGIIEGVPQISNVKTLVDTEFWPRLLTSFLSLVMFIGICVAIFFITAGIIYIVEKTSKRINLGDKTKEFWKKAKVALFVLGCILFFIILIFGAYLKIRQGIANEVTKYIPEKLRPEVKSK